jgi:hypothetical protein
MWKDKDFLTQPNKKKLQKMPPFSPVSGTRFRDCFLLIFNLILHH